ncbi:MAG: MarR family transcriptional regulator, partial [Bacteroidota bacterium]
AKINDSAGQVKELIAENPGIQPSEISDKTGISRSRVSQILGYLKDNDAIYQKATGVGVARQCFVTDTEKRRQIISKRWRK